MSLLNRGKQPGVTLRLPLPMNDVTKATSIVTVSAEAHTLTAGAAGTKGTFMLNFGPVASLLGDVVGKFGDSSLTFAGTALTTEVAYEAVLARQSVYSNLNDEATNVTSLLNPGEYYVVYETGRVFYSKFDSSTSAPASYLYRGITLNASFATATFQNEAADTATSGTVAATNGAGGTQIVAANAARYYTEFTNTGSVDAFFGTGTVDATFEPILAGQTKAWNSKQALKVLSSGANTNIAFTDYINA